MRIKLKKNRVKKKWFAWHPVIVNNQLIWLEYIDRNYVPKKPKGCVTADIG